MQAKFPNPPKRLPTLLKVLEHKGLSPVDPSERAGLNPFLVPLAKVSPKHASVCFSLLLLMLRTRTLLFICITNHVQA